MEKKELPKIFREKNTDNARAARIMHGMQHKLLEHFKDQADFLSSMVKLSELKQQRLYMYYPSVLMYPDKSIWDRLTSTQKSDLENVFLVIDPYTFECNVPGILNTDMIGTALRRESFNLRRDNDFTVSAGKITFVSGISVEGWDRTTVSVSISGRPIPVTIPVIPVLMYRAWFSEDWYYKRIGIFLGLPEYTAAPLVLAIYQLFLESSTERNLDALFGAYKGYDISLRNDDVVTEIVPETITTEKEIYKVPAFSSVDTLTVKVSSKLSMGDSLFDVCTIVNDTKHPGWFANSHLLKVLGTLGTSGVTDLETKLRALISDNSRLIWGSDLPIRISLDDEESLGLWLSAPAITLPVLKYSLGKDAVPESVSKTNMVMYSTLDRPLDYSVMITYTAASGEVEILFDGFPSETLTLDNGGVFVSVTGISGRVFNPEENGTWNGDIAQERGSVELDSAESTVLTFDVSGCTFNTGFMPDIGDWVCFEKDDVWLKAKINRVTERDADQIPQKFECLWYGRDLPDLGSYTSTIFQSYNGDPYTGVDSARIDAFGELLKLVSRHIEIIIVDGEIITALEAQQCLDEYRDYIDIWKAFIVLEASDSESFRRIREALDGYSET